MLQVKEKTRAARLCRERTAGKGSPRGAGIEVAEQLGHGPGSVRRCWRQQDIDNGQAPGRTISDADHIAELEAENFELQRTNDILRCAAARPTDPNPMHPPEAKVTGATPASANKATTRG